mmetsp:Transcript_31269/g.87690  ORF Transcript_31269/g.87690 Transcript_31269/m.87690 type:complete len:234 (-) Transcript_31269:293-994(-)
MGPSGKSITERLPVLKRKAEMASGPMPKACATIAEMTAPWATMTTSWPPSAAASLRAACHTPLMRSQKASRGSASGGGGSSRASTAVLPSQSERCRLRSFSDTTTCSGCPLPRPLLTALAVSLHRRAGLQNTRRTLAPDSPMASRRCRICSSPRKLTPSRSEHPSMTPASVLSVSQCRTRTSRPRALRPAPPPCSSGDAGDWFRRSRVTRVPCGAGTMSRMEMAPLDCSRRRK